MDLINREDAINAIYHHIPYMSRKRATIMLHEVQGMDLVRCEDCKWSDEEGRCEVHETLSGNDFCSKGERREE